MATMNFLPESERTQRSRIALGLDPKPGLLARDTPMATPTLDTIRTKTKAAFDAAHLRCLDSAFTDLPSALESTLLGRLYTRLQLGSLPERVLSPTTPQPSEPDPPTPALAGSSPSPVSLDAAAVTPEPEGTTAGELATIKAEYMARTAKPPMTRLTTLERELWGVDD